MIPDKDYAINFEDNICIVCGEHGTINGYNKFGKSVCDIDGTSDIMEYCCSSCDAPYMVEWDTINGTFKLVHKSTINKFEAIFNKEK